MLEDGAIDFSAEVDFAAAMTGELARDLVGEPGCSSLLRERLGEGVATPSDHKRSLAPVAAFTPWERGRSAPASSAIIRQKRKPLRPLSTREANRLRKAYPEIEATLDLHGLGKIDAYGRVQDFLYQQQAAGARHVMIITGKGRIGDGVLRRELPHWLNDISLRPLVSAFASGRPEKGGHGVTHVLVKAHRE